MKGYGKKTGNSAGKGGLIKTPMQVPKKGMRGK
jgi:hypothetical protein